MRFFSLLIVFSMLAQSALAAPLWLERRFVLAPELIDPVFAEPNAEARDTVDHTAWDAFLETYLVAGDDGINRVRYRAVAPADTQALGRYIAKLEGVDPGQLAPDEQLAFWINLYNAVTVRSMINAPTITSIRDVDSVWDKKEVTVNGIDLSLNDVEHGIIRPVFKDPRIHYAVNCASIGCPNLAARAYTGEAVDAMLDAAARAYVNHPRGVSVSGRKVRASKIFGWYREDFGADEAEVLDHVRQYAEPGLLDALAGKTTINSYAYDWDLNIAE